MLGVHSFPFGPHTVKREGGLFLIFEMANNHQGSLDHAVKIIRAMGSIARTKGVAGAIKFQFRQLESLIHPGFLHSRLPTSSNKHVKRFIQTRLSYEQYEQLVQESHDNGLVPFATSFDEASVDWSESLELPVIKIASCSATDWPLLRRIAQAKTPVVCSTAGCSWLDIDNVVTFFTERKIPLAIMHCVGLYPVPRQHVSMDQVRQLRQRYPDLVIGYSGHESVDDLDLVQLAVAVGAALLERHVGLPTDTISLNAYSLSPEDVEHWVDLALKAHQAMCIGDKQVHLDTEIRSLSELKRGIYAKVSKKSGEFLEPDDLTLAMPCLPDQFSASEFDDVIGLPVPHQGIAAMMPVMKKGGVEPLVEIYASSIVERIKGMLKEAKIALPSGTPAELSHPHGLRSFEKAGVVIIDVVNREYCKKLLVQLPGQDHPPHKHIKKEETFQVLMGELEVEVSGETALLKAGESLTIPRGVLHAFRTKTGMIMEEISTTHIKGDSFYLDENIPSDPTTRKTPVVL
ncbi:N-acetylneuraminate synthase family protein [Acidobacteria bacterium AH-259-L09]|nr:N-acetylneuraminate synthase family protein [Acidobacteria bacterium AH-259-L09]